MPGKLHVKKGDLVKVISGDDKGQTGRVLQAFPRENKVIVEGVNRVTRHTKVNYQGQRGAKQGGPETKEAPIHASNVKRVKEEKPDKPDKADAAEKAEKAEKPAKTDKAESKSEAGEDE